MYINVTHKILNGNTNTRVGSDRPKALLAAKRQMIKLRQIKENMSLLKLGRYQKAKEIKKIILKNTTKKIFAWASQTQPVNRRVKYLHLKKKWIL